MRGNDILLEIKFVFSTIKCNTKLIFPIHFLENESSRIENQKY